VCCRDVLAGHSVVDSSQADLPVIVAAVVDPLTNHLQVGVSHRTKSNQGPAIIVFQSWFSA